MVPATPPTRRPSLPRLRPHAADAHLRPDEAHHGSSGIVSRMVGARSETERQVRLFFVSLSLSRWTSSPSLASTLRVVADLLPLPQRVHRFASFSSLPAPPRLARRHRPEDAAQYAREVQLRRERRELGFDGTTGSGGGGGSEEEGEDGVGFHVSLRFSLIYCCL